MARQLRIEFEGAFYHVTSRGNLRERIFFQESDREKFLEILRRTRGRYDYLLHAYALMDNHYHLLIETPKANLSRIMQNINTSHTVYVNRKYGRSGHLFQGRFKGIIVDKNEYLVTLSRYIHLNPARAKIVERPEDYGWSSYKYYVAEAGQDDLVATSDTLGFFSEHKRQAMKAYRAFVDAGIEADDNPIQSVESGFILGSSGFKKKVKRILSDREPNEELPQLKRFREIVPISTVIKTCCGYYNTSEQELVRRGKGKQAREIAIYLSKVLSREKNKEIGLRFGIKGPAVSGVIKKLEHQVERDNRLKQEVSHLKGKVLNDF